LLVQGGEGAFCGVQGPAQRGEVPLRAAVFGVIDAPAAGTGAAAADERELQSPDPAHQAAMPAPQTGPRAVPLPGVQA
jgi:hypothetical protein